MPAWVLTALDALPQEMATADRRAKRYERAIIDLVEVALLAPRVGEVFTGTVVEVEEGKERGTVVISDPAVEAEVSGAALPLGHEIQVRLVSADFAHGAVTFEMAG